MGNNRIIIIILVLAIASSILAALLPRSPAPPPSSPSTTPLNSPTFSQNYNLPSLLGMAIWATPTPSMTPTGQPSATPTRIPTATVRPTGTGAPTIPAPTNTGTVNPSATPRPTVVAGACSAMDNELPNARMHYPDGSTAMPSTTREICGWDGLRYYSLPYRNPNCRASQAGIDEAARRIPSFYQNLDRPNRLLQDWRTVQDYAVKYNFNPIFVIALWIEESGASGVSYATKLGCDYRLNKDDTFTQMPANSTICEQMECTFGRRSVDPRNFGSWGCQYRWGSSAWNGTNCANPVNHTKVLEFWYNEIAARSSVPGNCWPQYFSGAHPGC